MIRFSLPVAALLGLTLLACGSNRTSGSQPETVKGSVASTGEGANKLEGTVWQLEDLAGTRVLPDVQATLEFPEGGGVSGKGSCNRFFGAFEASGDTLKFSAMASTRMACAGPINAQETAYLKALQDAERFEMQGTALLIYSKEMDKPLRFKPKQ